MYSRRSGSRRLFQVGGGGGGVGSWELRNECVGGFLLITWALIADIEIRRWMFCG